MDKINYIKAAFKDDKRFINLCLDLDKIKPEQKKNVLNTIVYQLKKDLTRIFSNKVNSGKINTPYAQSLMNLFSELVDEHNRIQLYRVDKQKIVTPYQIGTFSRANFIMGFDKAACKINLEKISSVTYNNNERNAFLVAG